MSEPDTANAERVIAAGSKSFAAAARLFDRETRDSAVLLYAWCRHCDDAIDGQELGFSSGQTDAVHDPEAALVELERRTRAALRGEAATGPFAGLAAVARRTGLPPELPLDHLQGFRMDVAGRRYGTLPELLEYCYGVAGAVGVMMAHVMGVRDEAVLDRACDLGLAFQLTNIARDIVEDARIGRVYVPAEWLREAGLPDAEPGTVADPARRPALAAVAARLVAAAEPYYASAAAGIPALPFRSAWAIATARGVYRAIGTEVVRRGPAAWNTRVSTGKAAKLGHVALGGAVALLVRGAKARPGPSRAGLYVRPRAEGSRHQGR